MAVIKGTTGNDNLVGTSTYDTINGDAGDDIIDGGFGPDKMAGGEGNDTFIGGDGVDYMDGGVGVDAVDYSGSTQGVRVYLNTGNGYGGQAEGDTLISIEKLTGSQYRDVLVGNDDNNTINGGGSDDSISGGGGNDVLIGGQGNDILTGGSGTDTFTFLASYYYGGPSGADVITDFQVGEDVLHFSTPGWQTASMDYLAFSQVGSDTVISYGGDSVTLRGVQLDQLMANASHDFMFS